MKKILFALFVLSTFVATAQTQVSDSLITKLMIDLENEKWEEVTVCFHKFANENPENAEVFYWVKASDKPALSDTLLLGLAKIYYEKGNQTKSIELCKAYIKKDKEFKVDELLTLAQLLTNLGEVRLTQNLYLSVIEKDPNNLNANLFLGNFLYLRAERERKRIHFAFKQKVKPTRMEYAEYRDKIKALYNSSYVKAQQYLQVAYKKVNSAELKVTLDHIEEIKKEVL